MIKLDRSKIFFGAKLLALFVGFALCLAFQFSGVVVCGMIGLAFFAAAFLMMAITEIEKLVYLANTKIEAASEEERQLKTKELHNKKLVAVVKMILSGAFAVFTIVVMCLF